MQRQYLAIAMATALSPLAAFWRQQVQLCSARLSQIEQQLGDLERQRNGAMGLDPAGARELQDAITREIESTREEYEKTKARCENLHTLYWRQRMGNFPPELLCHIFKDVLGDSRGQPPPLDDSARCSERYRAPFVLAAVCRRWRALALGTQSLWTYVYIHVRHATELGNHDQELLVTLLARSQKAPLTVVLPWSTARHPDTIWDMDTTTSVAKTLVLLAAEAHRWRSIEIGIAPEALNVPAMGLFRTVTPQLEHCAIHGPHVMQDESLPWTPESPNFLPVAPKLRSFLSDGSNIFPTTRGGPYKALAELTLSVNMPCVAVWDILRSAASRLEVLDIHMKGDPPDSDHLIPRPITFPLLRLLKVHSGADLLFRTNGTRVAMPLLRALEMHGIDPADFRQWWQHTPLSIEELVLDGASTEDANDADELLSLARIKRLTLSGCMLRGRFLDALARPRADGHWICPQLESVILNQDSLVEDRDGEAFVRVFQARKDAHRAGAEHAPRALREMLLPWAFVPGWAADQVRYILNSDA